MECLERPVRDVVELGLAVGGEDEVAEPFRAGVERREHHSFAPVEPSLLHAVELESWGGIEGEDATGWGHDEPPLAIRCRRLAVLEICRGELAQPPQDVRANRVEA